MRVVCQNCGKSMPEEAARYCKMHDMCIESQNLDNLFLYNVSIGAMARHPRSLCYLCWFYNNQTCYVCDLELANASK